MRVITSTLLLLLSLLTMVAGQTPPAFYYQASIRNTDGSVMVQQQTFFLVSLHQGSETGEVVYTETHIATTDQQGVVDLPIGGGEPTFGNFAEVQWDQTIFVEVSLKLNDADEFSILGITEIHAVPYSVFAARGNEGPAGDIGTPGSSIVWLGISDIIPEDPQVNQAYYNTVDGKSYIYNGADWDIFAQDGLSAEDGIAGVSIQWLEISATTPIDPQENQAYYNLIDGKSYIYDGTEWNILTQDGLPAEDGEPGTSIHWLGISDVVPEEAVLNNAYYNTTDEKSYIYDGTVWQILAQDGQQGGTVPLPFSTISNMLVHNGTSWVPTDRTKLTSSTFEVTRTSSSVTDAPVFAVYNSLGELVFAVHEGGTRVYVGPDDGTKGSKGGFAVGGLTPSKGEFNYLTILSDSIRFNIVENNGTKGSKGGFAVGGLTPSKLEPTHQYFTIVPDSVRFSLAENKIKGSKGGFAVGGLTPSKGDSDLFKVNVDTTYVNTDIEASLDVLVTQTVTVANPITTSPVKDIDGNSYTTTDIGEQRWMSENLRVTRYRDGTPIETDLLPTQWQDTTVGLYTIYPNSEISGVDTDSLVNLMYGKLYNGYATIHSLGLCPTGWIVPTEEDWLELFNYLGGIDAAGGSLKSIRTDPVAHPRWDAPNNGATNISNFKGIPGGELTSLGYELIGTKGNWWSASQAAGHGIHYAIGLNFDNIAAEIFSSTMTNGMSVRCVKTDALPLEVTTIGLTDTLPTSIMIQASVSEQGDSTIQIRGFVLGEEPNTIIENTDFIVNSPTGLGLFTAEIDGLKPLTSYYVRAYATSRFGTTYGNEINFTTPDYPNCGTVTDVDGNVYNTVLIGGQCWMKENLKTTKYRTAEPITTGLDTMQWGSTNDGAYVIYDHELVEGINSPEEMVNAYGLLYNWHAVVNSQGICPTGWAVPNSSDIQILAEYLGGFDIAGSKLKSTRVSPEPHPRWDGLYNTTNETGFSGLPSGRIEYSYYFTDLGYSAAWWTSSDTMEFQPILYGLFGIDEYLLKTYSNYNTGLTIRCINTGINPPNIITNAVTDIEAATAMGGGTVIDDGGGEIEKQGVVWGPTENPSIEQHLGLAFAPESETTFSVMIDKLEPEMTYYLRAFAENRAGITYGNQVEFTTTGVPNCGTVTDADGNVYNTVLIGDQCWMRENLKTERSRFGNPLDTVWNYPQDTAGVFYYSDSSYFKDYYGALYSRGAALSDSVCPSGWYVPTNEDWQTLIDYLGGESVAGGHLKATKLFSSMSPDDHPYWFEPNIGATNSSLFYAYPGGEGTEFLMSKASNPNAYSSGMGYYATFWTSTPGPDMNTYMLRLSNDSENAILETSYNLSIGYSIRCISTGGKPRVSTIPGDVISTTEANIQGFISDESNLTLTEVGVVWSSINENPTIEDYEGSLSQVYALNSFSINISGLAPNTTYFARVYATDGTNTGYGKTHKFTTFNRQFSDNDGNDYYSVIIGEQEWMTSNLKTTKFKDGTYIGNVDWYSQTGAFTWYNGTTIGDSINFKDSHGAYYSLNAVMSDNLCPSGWYIPSLDDYDILINTLGYETAGTKLKSTNTNPPLGFPAWLKDYSFKPNSNESGFTALATNYFNGSSFDTYNDGRVGKWWTTTEGSGGTKSEMQYVLSLNYDYDYASIYEEFALDMGLNVRCISTFDKPRVKTLFPTEITDTSATVGGDVIDDGGFALTGNGIVWSTSNENPTIADNVLPLTTGLGEFTGELNGLTPNTKYYFRAYATNSEGTNYGKTVSITTYNRKIDGIDGDSYYTIIIGGQEWFAENLKTTMYRTGYSIGTTWGIAFGAYAHYYDNITYADTTGALYNWYAIEGDSICPTGWRVPLDYDWKVLEQTIGMSQVEIDRDFDRGNVAYKLKETGTYGWDPENADATNETGFTARGGGHRSTDNFYYDYRNIGYFWSKTMDVNPIARYIYGNNMGNANIFRQTYDPNYGFSVRCILDDGLPLLSTTVITNITTTTAETGGTIIREGSSAVSNAGVVWSTIENPDITTNEGMTTGDVVSGDVFTSQITGLLPNTVYYVRAYATNTEGTGYGNQIIIRTASLGKVTEDFETGSFSSEWIQGTPEWTIDAGEKYEGAFSARSGVITHNGITSLSMTFETIAGSISFYRKVSSESGYDYLTFKINGSQYDMWSGDYPWEKVSYSVEAGFNTFTWEYTKDGSADWGSDCAWIDNIVFPHEVSFQVIVTDFNTSMPIESAEVSIYESTEFTDGSGVANFTIPAGGYSISVNASGYEYYEQPVEIFLGMEPIQVALNPSPLMVMFTVTDGVVGIEMAEVIIEGQYLYTDINGQTYTYLQPGNYPYSVTASGFLPYGGSAEVYDMGGGVAYIDVVMTVDEPVTFNVFDESTSNPVNYAEILIDGYSSIFTDEFGVASIELPDGFYNFTVVADGFLTYMGDVTVDVGLIDPVEVLLTPGVKDIEGNEYKIVEIGSQFWMAENLKTLTYNNSDPIPTGLSEVEWSNAIDGASAIYPFASVPDINSDQEMIDAFGVLYNWFAVSDPRGICPTGWMVPTDQHWLDLVEYLTTVLLYGNETDNPAGLGNALKSCRQEDSPLGGECTTTIHPRWDTQATHHGNDALGFSALPSGFIDATGIYSSIGDRVIFWSSTIFDTSNSWYRSLINEYGSLNSFNGDQKQGFSVRCVQE